MLSSGFTDAPVTRILIYSLVAFSLLASVTDTKHYFYIFVEPHIWRYHQLWRMLIYQFCFTNSTELLFATMTLYHLRVIERLWGSRKFAVCTSPCGQTDFSLQTADDYDNDVPNAWQQQIANLLCNSLSSSSSTRSLRSFHPSYSPSSYALSPSTKSITSQLDLRHSSLPSWHNTTPPFHTSTRTVLPPALLPPHPQMTPSLHPV